MNFLSSHNSEVVRFIVGFLGDGNHRMELVHYFIIKKILFWQFLDPSINKINLTLIKKYPPGVLGNHRNSEKKNFTLLAKIHIF